MSALKNAYDFLPIQADASPTKTDWQTVGRPCPLCNGTLFKLLYEKNGFPLMRCRGCGLVSTGSYPPGSARSGTPALTELYEDRYPQAIFWRERPRKLAKSRVEMALLQKLGGPTEDTPHLLDIGCSYGFFLETARDQGWSVEGVELSPVAWRWATHQSGLKVYNGFLEEAGLDDNSFDVVTIRHVLEHIPRLETVLTEIRRILKPGGLFLVAVPNLDSLNYRLTGRDWWWIDPPTHWWYFNRRTLGRLLAKYGFRPVHTSTHRSDDQSFLQASVFGLNQKLKLMRTLRRLKLAGQPPTVPTSDSSDLAEPSQSKGWQTVVDAGEWLHRYGRPLGWLAEQGGLGGELLMVATNAK